jgi:hypothetical protein
MTGPDAIARIHFFCTDQGGRRTDVAPASRFGYMPTLFFNGEKHGYDCALLVEAVGGRIARGATVEIPIKFLSPQLVKPRLGLGDRFTLWEGRTVAEGEVIELFGGS